MPQIVCYRFIKKKSKHRFGEFEFEYFGGSNVFIVFSPKQLKEIGKKTYFSEKESATKPHLES